MSLKKMTRIDKISQLLIAKTGVSIRELAVELGVSEITIRRDLKQLEQQGTVKLINGVAIHRAAQNPHSTLPRVQSGLRGSPLWRPEGPHRQKAASLIEPTDVIAIDYRLHLLLPHTKSAQRRPPDRAHLLHEHPGPVDHASELRRDLRGRLPLSQHPDVL